MKNFIILIFFLVILIAPTSVLSKNLTECTWKNKDGVPCVTIRTPNSNSISDKILPSFIINKKKIEDNNLIDLTSVLNFVNGINFSQSGPTGQQTSVFLRGTNSNHTLVLLNGIPINDQSTTNGAYDFGQDFLSNISQIEIYKGAAGAHFGPDAIGGAINLITVIDYENKLTFGGINNNKNINGNYTNSFNDWIINLQGGLHRSKTVSALKGGTDKDGSKNKSIGLNVVKWLSDHTKFRTNLFRRNTYADLDGHSLNLQDGFDADNTMYAFQTGVDYISQNYRNYITLHSHKYDRDYNSPDNEFDEYVSKSHLLRAEHTKNSLDNFNYGFGLEYKYDESSFTNRGSTYNSSLSGNYNNKSIFSNVGYKPYEGILTSVSFRNDYNNIIGNGKSYKIGFLKEDLIENLNINISYRTGFKNPSLYEMYGADDSGYKGNSKLAPEKSNSNEIMFDYKFNSKSKVSISLFKSQIKDLIKYTNKTYDNTLDEIEQSGIEFDFVLKNKKNYLAIFGSSLSSEKNDGSAQLRRPELSAGFNYNKILNDDFKLVSSYKYKGEHFDIHNSNWSTIIMPEVHLLNLGIKKNYYGIDLGLQINNLLNEKYESPHGFTQNSRKFNFVLNKPF